MSTQTNGNDEKEFAKYLASADGRWQKGDRDGCIKQYERALKIARVLKDEEKEGMVLMGLGFTMLRIDSLEFKREGIDHMKAAKKIAIKRNERAQVAFVENIILKSEAQLRKKERTDKKKLKGTKSSPIPEAEDVWEAVVKGLVIKAGVMFFMKGTPEKPMCTYSLQALQTLDKIGLKFETYNVMKANSGIHKALKKQGNWATFPQLYVNGLLFGGNDVIQGLAEDDMLKEELAKAGVPKEGFGNPRERCSPEAGVCSSENLGSLGVELDELEEELLLLISKEGTGNWNSLAATLEAKCGRKLSAEELKRRWTAIAPVIRSKVEEQAKMKCGHSCFTCPTRHECKLHETLDQDIEDLVAPT
mmetsp:Transcript_33116/g.80458  ORF Transcript_33116/g.80458 Transcript_33116/m.80458 type:complete len:361 (+) Transcript_33116:53-1135(+)